MWILESSLTSRESVRQLMIGCPISLVYAALTGFSVFVVQNLAEKDPLSKINYGMENMYDDLDDLNVASPSSPDSWRPS